MPRNTRHSASPAIVACEDADADPACAGRYWCANDPFRTRFYQTMSLMAPEAERFFIASIRAYLDDIDDPGLREQCCRFIREEAQHSRVHHGLNRQIHAGLADATELLRPARGLLDWVQRHGSRQFRLALTVAGEHLSAIMSELFLCGGRAQEINNARIREVYLWHAREEMGHRAVAFDLLKQRAHASYLQRAAALLLVSLVAPLVLVPLFVRLMRGDRAGRQPDTWRRGLGWLLGWRQPGPGPAHLLRNYLRYFRPGFHPRQIATPA
ncbi:metal-dependent hydrolase [Sinimarinibacterium sp. CAU 1509]|uniref:metal-dependent hydrolase n=1 Tax=Sinimarinibacterium sp. CAU 1509 TaxID=2562283 RepID=UPI0010ABCA6A|nr:metal-dependent hydrolase [Sinimarinibacterium sp. CAU 1509]TJY58268.1 metal-dependent hydrolase [Sinimarinibacterium sp. CAU 1509]